MGLNAFTRDVGSIEGRVEPENWVPQDSGSWVFCIGRDQIGFDDTINVGDAALVEQSAPFVCNVFRVNARMRPPTTIPDGVWWRASMLVDGVEVVGKIFPPRRVRDFHDWAWSFAHNAAGNHAVAFRLQLLGAAGTYELEIPAFYVDALSLDPTTARPILINRDPEPGETQVPADSTIGLDIVDVGPDGIDLAHTTISVNNVVAYTAGAFQAGFTGPASAVSSPQSDTKRFVIDPLGTFSNQQVVTIHVQTQTLTSAIPLDLRYSFTAERLLGPSVVDVQPIGQRTINVTFDEAVTQGDGTGGTDALNPANYAIARNEGDCVVALAVVAVASLGAAQVQLTTDIEQTPGGAYTLTVTGVRDLFGNLVVP